MSSLEKPKRKYKAKKLPVSSVKRNGFQKQKQQQTVIVNINKQKRGERGRSSIEKPKEQKEQPKTINQFSFSMPSTQNPIGDYIKIYQKDLFNKIERAIKTKDSVINSVDEPVTISTQSVKELKRTPTVLETIPVPTTLDNFLKNQEELKKPLVIGEPTVLPDVTTLDAPESLSLDEEPNPVGVSPTTTTIETLKAVEEPPDLFALIKKRGRPPLSDAEKELRAEIKASTKRPVGRPVGVRNRSRFIEEIS